MRKKILVIDDDPGIVQALADILDLNGFDVITAYDGAQGLDKARNESPDLITLDIMMPEVNGYTICGILKSDERYCAIPIIVLTARDGEMDRCFDQSVAPDAYLNKPFESKELLSLIDNLLR